MDEELKRKAYLEGMKLKKAGFDDEVIYARLEKQGIPGDISRNVIKNLNIQKQADKIEEKKSSNNTALYSSLLKVGLGVLLAIVSAIIFPGYIILPIGLIAGGIFYAIIAKIKLKQ